MTKRPRNIFTDYHAHIYFDESTIEHATTLCERAGKLFHINVGRIHNNPVGPHPSGSCQLTFNHLLFDQLIPWLEENRRGLTILVHAVTGNNLEDHTTNAAWLGDEVSLDISMFVA